MSIHLIALGANSGHNLTANARNLAKAQGQLRAAFGRNVIFSRSYATPAWPPGIGPDFVNAAAVVTSKMPPRAMLSKLHRIEASHGRQRVVRWAPRVIDLDLLATDGLVRPDAHALTWWRNLSSDDQARLFPDQLLLPHPRMQDRGFVLIPLSEVAPGWRHPVTGRRIADMVQALPRAALDGIRPIRPA